MKSFHHETDKSSSSFTDLNTILTTAQRECEEGINQTIGSTLQAVNATLKQGQIRESIQQSLRLLSAGQSLCLSTTQVLEKSAQSMTRLQQSAISIADDLNQIPSIYDKIKLEHMSTLPAPPASVLSPNS